MKKLYGIDHDFGGGDVKGKVDGTIGIEGSDATIRLTVDAKYPVEKVLNPAFKAADELIDKIEKWIPGDQVDQAAALKAAFRARVVQLISEKPAEESPAQIQSGDPNE